MQYWNYTNNESWYTSSAFKNCPYGCVDNACREAPITEYGIYFIVIIIILVVIGVIIKLWSRA
jgi:hypothetical protein